MGYRVKLGNTAFVLAGDCLEGFFVMAIFAFSLFMALTAWAFVGNYALKFLWSVKTVYNAMKSNRAKSTFHGVAV